VLYTFAIYMAVTLGTGCGLLLVWRQDRTQTFSALLGLSHLIWSLTPLAYLAARSLDPAWQIGGRVALILSAAAYLNLLMLGFSHLSGHPFNRRKALWVTVLIAASSFPLMMTHPQWAQLAFAVLNTAIGVIVASWLRKMGPGEKLCGVLIVLCGLNQFTYGLMGEPGALLQTAIAAALRLLLGMSLMYAALTRSGQAVKRMRDRFFELTERSPQGVTVVRKGMVAYANPAFRQIYGVSDMTECPRIWSKDWLDVTVPESERQAAEAIARRIVDGSLTQAEWSGERRSLDGRRLHLRFRAWEVEWDGAPALQVVIVDDTARVEADRALHWRATHDELTGLPNRNALLQRLRDLFEQPVRLAFALILMDVDRFKFFNEAHGQGVGDEVLKVLAANLRERFADHAEVMRLGEDEFALLLMGEDPVAAADAAAQSIKEMLRDPLALPDHTFFLDVSMGVASCPSSAHSADALLQAAHAAMHEAKRLPGTSVQWATEQGTQGLVAFFSAEQALRAGLQNEEFNLVYQPKVAAHSGQLLGFEALVRWDRPGLGRINPMDFIPAAERTGLIVPLGAQILTVACKQMALWREQGLHVVPVAVNVSPLQLLDAEFPAAVMSTLREFNLPPQCLTLEITETAAVTHMDQANEQISQLRQHGVEVALDDFGTGFSSLNMLRSLPLRTVKIDRSLIDPMPSQEANAVVKAICDLAAVLRLDVVAEGVETEAHASAALRAGCDALQGFLFAQPLEVDEATRWLIERY
jgi:diguanylate cyclase (GGDEF)-like protein/PAS domain S-box-containing protein